MKKLLLVLVFAGIMSPICFGDILVYKFTASYDPYISHSTDTSSWVYSSKQAGYLVMDVNDFNIGSLKSAPTIIYYNSPCKWYWHFDVNMPDEGTDYEIYTIEGTKNEGTLCHLHWIAWETGSCILYGKGKISDIGRPDQKMVLISASLKGIIQCWNDYFETFGPISATLDSKSTKSDNTGGLTQAQAVKVITDYFDNNGYTETH